MKRNKSQSYVSAKQRLFEFPNGPFSIVNNRLYCNVCNKPVDHTYTTVVKNHLDSKIHTKLAVLGTNLKQKEIFESLNSADIRQRRSLIL